MPKPRPRRLAPPTSALLVLLALQPQGAGAAPPARASAPAVAAALKRQADDWDRAIVRKDLPSIAANMADDFRHIRSDGSVAGRETFLKDITSPDLSIDPYTVEDFDVRLYGDVALLCGRTRMTGRFAGEPFVSHYRYVDTYVLRDGRWRVCNVQITPIREAGGK